MWPTPTPGYPGKNLQHDSIGQQRSHFARAVQGRGQLDNICAYHRQFERAATHRVEQLARRQPAGLGRSRSGGHPWVHDIDVYRQEHAVAVLDCDGKHSSNTGPDVLEWMAEQGMRSYEMSAISARGLNAGQ